MRWVGHAAGQQSRGEGGVGWVCVFFGSVRAVTRGVRRGHGLSAPARARPLAPVHGRRCAPPPPRMCASRGRERAAKRGWARARPPPCKTEGGGGGPPSGTRVGRARGPRGVEIPPHPPAGSVFTSRCGIEQSEADCGVNRPPHKQ